MSQEITVNEINRWHQSAMDLATEADRISSHGRRHNDTAVRLYEQAWRLERDAARGTEVEPSRTVLYRSASSLAYCAGDIVECLILAIDGLVGDGPKEIKNEIAEVARKAIRRIGR